MVILCPDVATALWYPNAPDVINNPAAIGVGINDIDEDKKSKFGPVAPVSPVFPVFPVFPVTPVSPFFINSKLTVSPILYIFGISWSA